VDTGRMAFRSQTRRARGDLGLPFFISCGRSKMTKGRKRRIPMRVQHNIGPFTKPLEPYVTTGPAVRNKNKSERVRKPKALRGMR